MLKVSVAAPQVDHLLTVLVDTDRGADLAAAAKIVFKGGKHAREFGIAGAAANLPSNLFRCRHVFSERSRPASDRRTERSVAAKSARLLARSIPVTS